LNISGLIRSIIGDTQAAEPKTLELKAGEVVKGLVLQLLADQDALINIGGVHVRARLETPLKQGQVTLLQVQPETTPSGQIILKPLNGSGVQIAEESLADVLKNVGLQDSASNRQLVQTLHQSGISLSKEHVQMFAKLQTQLPTSLLQEDWIQPAAVVFQKGIPLTPDTVAAVRQAVSGPGFHETLQELDGQLSKLLSGGSHSSLSEATRSALLTAKQAVMTVRDASNQMHSHPELSQDVLLSQGGNRPQVGGSSAAAVITGRQAGAESGLSAQSSEATAAPLSGGAAAAGRGSDAITQPGSLNSPGAAAGPAGSAPIVSGNPNAAVNQEIPL